MLRSRRIEHTAQPWLITLPTPVCNLPTYRTHSYLSPCLGVSVSAASFERKKGITIRSYNVQQPANAFKQHTTFLYLAFLPFASSYPSIYYFLLLCIFVRFRPLVPTIILFCYFSSALAYYLSILLMFVLLLSISHSSPNSSSPSQCTAFLFDDTGQSIVSTDICEILFL